MIFARMENTVRKMKETLRQKIGGMPKNIPEKSLKNASGSGKAAIAKRASEAEEETSKPLEQKIPASKGPGNESPENGERDNGEMGKAGQEDNWGDVASADTASSFQKPIVDRVATPDEKTHLQLLREESELKEREFRLRESVIKNDVMPLFKIANILVIAVIVLAGVMDFVFIGMNHYQPEHRLISANVIMALIGATVVQLGAGMAAIFIYLFPKPPQNSNS